MVIQTMCYKAMIDRILKHCSACSCFALIAVAYKRHHYSACLMRTGREKAGACVNEEKLSE